MLNLNDFVSFHGKRSLGLEPKVTREMLKYLKEDERFGEGVRGPRRAVLPTPYNISYVILAALANGPTVRALETAVAYYMLPHEDTHVQDGIEHFSACGLTDALFLGDALQAILENPHELADRVVSLEVFHDHKEAILTFLHSGSSKKGTTRFVDGVERGEIDQIDKGCARPRTPIGGEKLKEMAEDLAVFENIRSSRLFAKRSG